MNVTVLDDQRLGLPSASKMGAIFACAGLLGAEAVVEEQKFKAPEGSAVASKGTMLHRAVELGDVTNLDDDDADLVIKVRETEEQLVGDWIASTGHTLSDVTIYRELRLWVGAEFSAQLDTAVVNHKNSTAFVLDTKTGRKKVAPPPRNWQLRACAVALAVNFKVETVRTAIIQPLVEEHAVCDYSKEHLAAAKARISERLELVKRPGMSRTSGSHCEHCKAQHICPEARASMSAVILAQGLSWENVTPAEKLNLWKAAIMAEDCAKLIKDTIRAEIRVDKGAVPGLIKGKDQAPRKVTNVAGMISALLDRIVGPESPETITRRHIALVAILPMMKISVADSMQILKDVTGMRKSDAERFVSQCSDFITEGFRQGAISVVEEGK